jgi:hypothetical protein
MNLSKVHQAVRERNFNICDICKRVLPDNMLCAHHVRSRGSRPDLALDPNNCLCVCQRCHNRCHSGEISKEEQLNKLPCINKQDGNSF